MLSADKLADKKNNYRPSLGESIGRCWADDLGGFCQTAFKTWKNS